VEPSLSIVDLVPLIDDRDPQAMFDEWSAAVQASDPTWVPVNGSLESVIAEALCLSVSDLIYSVNRLPGVVLEGLLALKDVPRHPGEPTTGAVRIFLDSVRTITITEGSRFMIDALEFVASETVTATADQVVVDVVAVDPGALGNTVLPGMGVDWLDLDPHAVSVTAEGAFTGGSDPEDDRAYRARVASTFILDSQGLVLPSAFVAWAGNLPDVGRASAVNLWDPDSGNDPGEDGGHITIYLYGNSGALTPERMAEIEADLTDRAQANLQVHVAVAEVLSLDVEMSVRLAPGATEAAVLADVEAALRTAISPAVWPWGETITRAEMQAIAARVPGVDYAVEVTVPDIDLPLLPGYLPTLDVVTVTVAGD
jgi:uncharacterized phage protein gp47/JayE